MPPLNLSFDNTRVAFEHKSDQDLWKAKKLFQMFSSPFLVNQGPVLANAALSIGLPIKGLIKKTIFHQFCGGETIEESLFSAEELNRSGVKAILDYSVEGKASEQSYRACYAELLNVIKFCGGKDSFPFTVFKATGIADADMLTKLAVGIPMNKEEDRAKQSYFERFNSLCDSAVQHNIPILVDAEESWIQDPIDELTYENMAKHNRETAMVYNTIQLYRKERIPHMKKQIELARERGYKVGFKLVRGAYMEKESDRAKEMGYPNPIQDSKADTDKDFDEALKLCFENKDVVSIIAGTHNEKSSLLLAQLIDSHGITKNDPRFWFAQLYGMSDHISFNLASEGFNVVKYLPYGPVKKVLPYLSRRAQENSSVKGQAGRELSYIEKEIARRKEA